MWRDSQKELVSKPLQLRPETPCSVLFANNCYHFVWERSSYSVVQCTFIIIIVFYIKYYSNSPLYEQNSFSKAA